MKHVNKLSKPAKAQEFGELTDVFCTLFRGECEDKCKGDDFEEILGICIELP